MPHCRLVVALIANVLGFGALPFAKPPRAIRVENVRMAAAPLPRNFPLVPAARIVGAPRAEAGGARSFAALAVLAVCGFAATWRRYRLRQKLRALLVAFSVCCIFFASPALAISTKAPAQTESGGRLVTIGVSAVLALLAYLSGTSADRKEDRRVKEEAKKLEARQAELELDGEVLVDESMSELLKDRENELAKGPSPKSEEDLSDDEFFEQRNEQLGARREQEDDANDNASGPSAEDIARMKRMFGGDSTGTDGMGDR